MSNLLRKAILEASAGKPATQAPEQEIAIKPEDQIFGCVAMESFELPCMELPVMAEIEIDQALDAEAEFQATAVSLESIADFLETACAKGGASAESADLAITLYHTTTERVSALRSELEMPSMESFDEDGAALMQTEMAKKAVAETIQKVINAISIAVNAAIEAAIKFYDQHLSKVGRLEGSLKELQSNAKAFKGEPKEKSLSVPKAEYLFLGGKLSDQDMGKICGKIAKGAEGLRKAIKAYNDAMAKFDDDSGAESIKTLDDARDVLVQEFKTCFGASKPVTLKHAAALSLGAEVKEVFASETLPGDSAIYVTVPAEGAKSTVSVKVTAAIGSASDVTAITGVSKKDGDNFVKRGLQAINGYRAMNAAGKETITEAKALLKAMKDVEKKTKDAKFEGQPLTDLIQHVNQVKQLVNAIRDSFTELTKWSSEVATANASAASAIYKNLGEKAAAEDPKADANPVVDPAPAEDPAPAPAEDPKADANPVVDPAPAEDPAPAAE